MDGTVYLKADASVEVDHPAVTLGDLFQIGGAAPAQKEGIRAIRLLCFPEPDRGGRAQRRVVSVLLAVEAIRREFPKLQVVSLGSADVIVTYVKARRDGRALHALKTAGVALVTFAGAAFSIMAFNNDVDVSRLFGQIYTFVTGEAKSGFTVLECTYSIGLVMGILIFFNHFGKKRFSQDPTPIEVQMRTYEGEIQSALVEACARKGRELDVDAADPSGDPGA